MPARLLYWLCIGAGALLAAGAAWRAWRAAATARWPRVRGTMLSAEVRVEERGPDQPPEVTLSLGYRYEAGGATRFGDRWRPDGNGIDSHADRAALLRRFAPGKEVWVHHHPGDPLRAVLEPGHAASAAAALAAWALLLLAAGAAGVAGWL